jgi:ribosomal protein S18 acetylase RimI-like enzyme
METRPSDAVHVRPYHPDVHLPAVFSIWERCFGERWPITPGIWREITAATLSGVSTHQLVATDGSGRVPGYIGSQFRPGKHTEASIVLLMVDPDCQRLGIGTRLLNTTLAIFAPPIGRGSWTGMAGWATESGRTIGWQVGN